ncbi:hypothetical protein NPS01_01490 [Nocardioides psychrotolerans]|uniref:Excreted virulence factor EspC, type VII ESX diderm n=1 Tax=Nocardioides psychrotolerans TaxID=1005945 RepID=A0A1I3BRG5_9ACTN|nr:hypothetical protein NPS01_01490 [Nocardioides psychrotolerans]SFH64908.1 hypothetical protein SAMN05216561_101291 [Nocardioides psychrotolerans]
MSSWDDLEALPARMADLAQQADEIVRHARAWVCRRDGFEPSPVCVLRPLAAAMDPLEAAFAELGRRFEDQWRDLTDGLRRAAADLAATDVATARDLGGLIPRSAP